MCVLTNLAVWSSTFLCVSMGRAGFVEPRVSDYGNAATRLTRVLRPNFNYRNFVLAGGEKKRRSAPRTIARTNCRRGESPLLSQVKMAAIRQSLSLLHLHFHADLLRANLQTSRLEVVSLDRTARIKSEGAASADKITFKNTRNLVYVDGTSNRY